MVDNALTLLVAGALGGTVPLVRALAHARLRDKLAPLSPRLRRQVVAYFLAAAATRLALAALVGGVVGYFTGHVVIACLVPLTFGLLYGLTPGLWMGELASTRARIRLATACPPRVEPGTEFTIRVFVWPETHEFDMDIAIRGEDPTAAWRPHASPAKDRDGRPAQWCDGTRVRVSCRGTGLQVEPPQRTFVWESEPISLAFDTRLTNKPTNKRVQIKIDVHVDDVPAGELRPVLFVDNAAAEPTLTSTTAPRTGFVSYSRKDKAEVARRASSIVAATGMQLFLDCLSIRAGERWRDRILHEVASCDQFLLFWSKNAAGSPWVALEMTHALRRGDKLFQIHPLDETPPPDALKHLHFGDPMVALFRAD